MKNSFLSDNDFSRFNRLKFDDDSILKIDLIDISTKIYNSVEKKYKENIINLIY